MQTKQIDHRKDCPEQNLLISLRIRTGVVLTKMNRIALEEISLIFKYFNILKCATRSAVNNLHCCQTGGRRVPRIMVCSQLEFSSTAVALDQSLSEERASYSLKASSKLESQLPSPQCTEPRYLRHRNVSESEGYANSLILFLLVLLQYLNQQHFKLGRDTLPE